MIRNFKFVVYLNANYCQANILTILENGLKLGCIYKNYERNIVNISEGIASLWELYLKKSPPLIRIKFYNTHFNTWFYNENNKIYLYLSPTHIGWKKKYDLSGSYGINFYRYQYFILHLIGNNLITHFETYEYINESYHPESIELDKKIYVKLYIYWPYDVYHHFKVNGKMLGITWLDENKQPINLKSKDNSFEDIFFNEEAPLQHWYGIRNNLLLKFSHLHDHTFIIEPMSIESSKSINQAELLDVGLRITIELFKNIHVFKLITFKSDEDIININKMDD